MMKYTRSWVNDRQNVHDDYEAIPRTAFHKRAVKKGLKIKVDFLKSTLLNKKYRGK